MFIYENALARLAELGYSGPYPFTIDGIEMPMPTNWNIEYPPLMDEGQRSVTTGELQLSFLGIFPKVIWEYSVIDGDNYDRIFDAYVKNTAITGNPWHTLTTLDDRNQLLTIETYYQSDFVGKRSLVRGPLRLYENQEFKFVAKKRWVP